MDLGLRDQVVFVAGSSRGIGKGIASVFLEEGARVVLTGRDTTALSSACAELSNGRADRVMTFHGDLVEVATIQEAYRQVRMQWGDVHTLVCNIGSGTAANGWQITASDWDAAFAMNLWASIRLVEVFLPEMIEARHGNIIFISSITGLESLGAPLQYGAAKAALEHYSKDLSRRVARDGIRVNTVAPGNILFPGGSWQRKLDVDSAATLSMIAAEVPMGRFGRPEDIGAAVAFLASDRASFITGACIVADGGQTRA
ncbi:MAG: SDR family oxidoreductase [Acidobacteriia bacterium]|nr:SDR family oxidoreductase [Terriglobia bacterium]